jgi:hypothetical protein
MDLANAPDAPDERAVKCNTAVLLVALALASCGGGEEPAGSSDLPSFCVSGAPSVEVGTGAASFIAIEPGGSVPIVSGPQGGSHIWISARTRGLGPSALVEYGANDMETGELLTWKGLRQVVALGAGEGGGEVHGLTGFLDDPNPAGSAGRSARIWILVTDDCDKSMGDEVHAMLAHPSP